MAAKIAKAESKVDDEEEAEEKKNDAPGADEDEAAEDKDEDKKASLSDLKAAFPKDREFALDQFEKGASILRAKAAYADKLMAAQSNERPAKPPTGRTAVPLGGTPTQASASYQTPVGDLLELRAAYNLKSDSGPATLAYWQAVQAFERKGQSRLDAQASVARTLPELHEDFVSEVNGLTGDRKWTRCPTKTPGGIVKR